MTTTTTRPPKRLGWAILVIFCLLWIGLAVGTGIGSRFVPPGSGLAGPAIALGYGVVGAFAAGLFGVVLAIKASPSVLRACGLGLGVLALGFVAMATWRFVSQRAEQRAKMGLDVALPPTADFRIHANLSEDYPTRGFREMTVNGYDWSFEYVAVGPEAALCQGTLKAEEVVELTESVAAMQTRLETGEEVCSGLSEVVIFQAAYYGEGGDWTAEAGIACTQRERELMAVATALGRIPRNAVGEGRLDCD